MRPRHTPALEAGQFVAHRSMSDASNELNVEQLSILQGFQWWSSTLSIDIRLSRPFNLHHRYDITFSITLHRIFLQQGFHPGGIQTHVHGALSAVTPTICTRTSPTPPVSMQRQVRHDSRVDACSLPPGSVRGWHAKRQRWLFLRHGRSCLLHQCFLLSQWRFQWQHLRKRSRSMLPSKRVRPTP